MDVDPLLPARGLYTASSTPMDVSYLSSLLVSVTNL